MPKTSRTCCIPGCDNTPETSKNLTVPLKFYKFPNDGPFTSWRKEKRRLWIEAVGIKNKDGSSWQPTKNTFVCSIHFVGGEKSENPLGPSYVPTLFPISYGTLNVSKSSERIVRILKPKESKVAETSSNPAKEASVSNTEMISTPDILMEGMSSSISQAKPESKMYISEVYTLTKSVESQANLPQAKRNPGMNCFICNMLVENGVCSAQVQVNIARTVDRAVECDALLHMMNRRDAACGPSIYDKQDFQIAGFQGISSIRSDAELTDFCGVTLATFELLVSLLPNISGKKLNAKNKLLIFLMKLKLGLSYPALGIFFNVHRSTVSKTFFEILLCLPTLLEEYVYWPTRDMAQKSLPSLFKPNYSHCRVIVDCVEVRVETPPGNDQRKSLYSNSKRALTVKFLVAFTPNGFICFKSKYHGGGTSNGLIADDSEFLDFIESGDLVLADEGFPDIKMNVKKKNATFFLPPFLEKPKCSSSGIEETRKVTSIRNHIKRCTERLKMFRTLSYLPADLLPHTDSIIHICCALVNLQLPMSQSE